MHNIGSKFFLTLQKLNINIFGFTQKGQRRQRKCGYCIIPLSLPNPHVGVLLYSLAPDTAHFLAAMYTMQKPPMCIWLVKNMGLNMNYHF
jgi:hypothetical protein